MQPDISQKTTEVSQPDSQPVALWLNPFVHFSMTGDVLARQYTKMHKLKWLLTIWLVPLGIAFYYYKVYVLNFQITADQPAMRTGVAANVDFNNIRFYAMLVALFGLLVCLGVVAIFYFFK